MSWRKYFTPVSTSGTKSPVSGNSSANLSRTNYSTILPDVYSGHPNRLERYQQYDTMDGDSEVNAALDILAEFCTQENEGNNTPFEIHFKEQATQTEVKILRRYLQQWTKLNKFNKRIFKIVRNTFKFGDCFFIRDPETQQWIHIDAAKVDKVIVNESDGKVPEQYIIRDLNLNLMTLAVSQITANDTSGTMGGTTYTTGGAQQRGMVGAVPQTATGRFDLNRRQVAIDAKHVIHITLSDSMDGNFPFGNSMLESIFKVYKQKELLEDAILIYRVQRAPERRVFYIDVGNMPSHMAMGFVERVKNEINQRRIPSVTGGGSGILDSSYNPLSQNEDYFFPQSESGRGSKVELLPGGCFAMDTRVPLLDGRVLTIAELAEEYQQGKENWTFSANPETGEITTGIISWAGVTQKSAKVLKLTLSNTLEIICTPEHKFPIIGKGLVEARHLVIGETFISNNGQEVTLYSVKVMPDEIEVGTLTIDQDEEFHNYHNFALEVGIFAQNSNLGEIDDLRYFTNKLFRALRIPSSYLPTGPDDGGSSFNDGRVGTAYIQELRFNKYCERLQGMMCEQFDTEFKLYLHNKGINVDSSIFDLQFNPPQNFASYRQAEMDTARVSTFTTMSDIPFISKRFALKRFLGLSDEEIAENQTMWREENLKDGYQGESATAELRSAGISSAGVSSDMNDIDQSSIPPEDAEEGDQGEQPTQPPQG